MKGSIRIALGFLVVFGAIGHDDFNTMQGIVVPLWETIVKSAIGLMIMLWGVNAHVQQTGGR